jgi:hypothetical protein
MTGARDTSRAPGLFYFIYLKKVTTNDAGSLFREGFFILFYFNDGRPSSCLFKFLSTLYNLLLAYFKCISIT